MRPGIVSLCLLFVAGVGSPLSAQNASRHFTVADDIRAVHFGDPYLDQVAPLTFSPNGQYFVVATERGLLTKDRPESTLRVYRTRDIHHFLQSRATLAPSPFWILSKSTYKDGPIITRVRWLANSRGFAFLQKTPEGKDQLFLANLRARATYQLTPQNQQVTSFDIRDIRNFAYTVLNVATGESKAAPGRTASVDGTGHSLYGLVFPSDFTLLSHVYDRCELWAVVDGKRFRVTDKETGRPLAIHAAGQRALALSPNGLSVMTALTVRTVPAQWENLYSTAMPYSAYRIKAGEQDPDALYGRTQVSEYAVVTLKSGQTRLLTGTPTGYISASWFSTPRVGWSADSQSVVLASAFLPPQQSSVGTTPNPPCVLVINLRKSSGTCLSESNSILDNGHEASSRSVERVRFAPRSSSRLILDYSAHGLRGSTAYVRHSDDSWTAAQTSLSPPIIDVSIQQDLNEPPILVASDTATQTSRVIWNPNPQLRNIRLGEASLFKWRDNNNRDWAGVLYKPPEYNRGTRYPLVIQTHGFSDKTFEPSGIYPTAFAARELAAVGMVVLQLRDCPPSISSQEGPCQIDGYESAVRQLTADGLVNPDRVGIVGFSRTCYYVLEALTTSELHFRAAAITSGVDEGYVQYIANVDTTGNALAHEADAILGSPPFGAGLQEWIKRSPLFNMDRVTAPVQVVASGPASLIFEMLEPYAALRYLNKPVDLIVLREGTHVLTNPAERMVSQGGTVDWFRFWLKDEEDALPSKSKQYARWRKLREMQNRTATQPLPVVPKASD